MDPLLLIDKYYPEDNELKHILLKHSRSVADKALAMARKHPELNLDLQFIEEAAMLHDIGIFQTDAEGICCFGKYPYICHGYLGAELVRKEQIICFADKFFSKSKLDHEKGIEKARKSVARYGEEGGKRFDYWCELFL